MNDSLLLSLTLAMEAVRAVEALARKLRCYLLSNNERCSENETTRTR
jgi:hypothetical protein